MLFLVDLNHCLAVPLTQHHQFAIEQLQYFLSKDPQHPLALYANGALAKSHLALNQFDALDQRLNKIAAHQQAPEQLKLYCLRLIARHYGTNHD